jgi:hypothetical protein
MTPEEHPPHPGQGDEQPSEEELRAAIEEQLRRVTVEDLLVQTIVSLVNLGGRRAGLAPGTEGERDVRQLGQAIEAVRALMPLIEPAAGAELAPIRDALSQLQLAYAQLAGQAEGATSADEPAAGPSEPAEPAEPGAQAPKEGPGPAEASGRLWVPGR